MTKAFNKKRSCGAWSVPRSLLAVAVFAAATSTAAGYGGVDDDGSSGDYYRGYDGGNGGKPLPVILMHKQALQQDGGFQYAFAADNGLRQGESIRPDGSRTGAYSYTDPNGKEITVKYTAGRDGFRIIQGDHVPKAPVSVVPLQQSPATVGSAYAAAPPSGRVGAPSKNRLFGAPGGPGSQFSRGDFGGGAYGSGEAFAAPYKPSKYPAKPQRLQHYRVREENSAELAARLEDDGSSAYDGAGDYSSHSPFRAPTYPARPAYRVAAAANRPKDDGEQYADNSDEQQQPHSFGNGYSFEFGGSNAGEQIEF